MTAFLVACGVGCFLCVQLFALGVILGVWTHSQVYSHFLVHTEGKFQRRYAVELGQLRAKQARLETAKGRMIAEFGRELPEEHRQVIEEEIESILGAARSNAGKR